MAGRTYVHTQVKSIIVNSYKVLETEQPNKVVKDESGQSVHLPTHPLNRFGYNIEFDSKGKYEEYTIDYVTLAAHIVALHKETKTQDVDFDIPCKEYVRN